MPNLDPLAIGAHCTIYYVDEEYEPLSRYISFGNYHERTECDSYGVSDDLIFFYAEGMGELETRKEEGYEWKIQSIDEIIYEGETI